MFSYEVEPRIGFLKPRFSTRTLAYKAFYKASLLSKADELLLRNLERQQSGPTERAGRQATQKKTRSGREPLTRRREIANSSPQCRRLRRNSGERSSTDDSAWDSREHATRGGAPRRRQRPRQDGLSTRWHLRDRRGCIPSCRGRLRGMRRGARTTHARRRERRQASSTRQRDDRRSRVPAISTQDAARCVRGRATTVQDDFRSIC